MSKLTDKDVLEICLNSTDSNTVLGERYGVARSWICNIRNNKAYRHVKRPDGISNRRSNRAKATATKMVSTITPTQLAAFEDEARARAVIAAPTAALGDKLKARDVLCALGVSDYDDFSPILAADPLPPGDDHKNLIAFTVASQFAILGGVVLLLVKVLGA